MPESENLPAGSAPVRGSAGRPPHNSEPHTTAPTYPPMPVKTVSVIVAGLVAWAVALVVILVVPALHEGERSWWPWSAAAGLALGLVGLVYVRRGRGNAEGVE